MDRLTQKIYYIMLFFSTLTCQSPINYELPAITAYDCGFEGTPREKKLMALWTHLDLLRAIRLENSEKFSFLGAIVKEVLELYVELAVNKPTPERDELRDLQELLETMQGAFDETYQMLTSDEIGCVRVIFAQCLQMLTNTTQYQNQ